MKHFIPLFLLFVLFTIASYAQSVYSKQNLEQASRDELNAYLKTSQKLKKTGAIISITGPVTIVAGFVVFAATYDEDAFLGYNTGTDIGGWMTLAGVGITLVGVPILITGSSRVKRITGIMNKNGLSFELAPYNFHDYMSKNNQVGITFRLNF